MARRKDVIRREPLPDWKYQNVMAAKFINGLMRQGKKSVAEHIFYQALDLIETRTDQEPLPVFEKAMRNVGPVVYVKSRRVGGSTYQVPVEVREHQQRAMAIRWLITAARARPEHTMAERLANEFIAAAKSEGAAVKRKEDTYRMAEANRAFAHYRW